MIVEPGFIQMAFVLTMLSCSRECNDFEEAHESKVFDFVSIATKVQFMRS
jgi:hypothetical protein